MALVAVLAAGLAACDDTLGPLRVADLATEALGFESSSITVPDTASVWRPFQVEVVTYHLRTCEEPAGADVRYEGMTATVTPYIRSVGTGNCPSHGKASPVRAVLFFTRRGTATVRFNVLQDERDPPVDVEYTVEVR